MTTHIIYIESTAKQANMPAWHSKSIKEVAKVRLAGKIKDVILNNLIAKNSYGSNWNGYGYADHYYEYVITATGYKSLKALTSTKAKTPKAVSEDSKLLAWCKRLSTLANISFEAAQIIAAEKIEYKQQKLEEMESRESERGFSVKRAKLIDKMRRENPLRRIESVEHAEAIIAASNRHNNSNYDMSLKYAHELELDGDLERGTSKEYARKNIKKL